MNTGLFRMKRVKNVALLGMMTDSAPSNPHAERVFGNLPSEFASHCHLRVTLFSATKQLSKRIRRL